MNQWMYKEAPVLIKMEDLTFQGETVGARIIGGPLDPTGVGLDHPAGRELCPSDLLT